MIGEGTNMQRTVIIISNGVLLWLGTVIISNGGGVGLVFNWIFIKYVSGLLSPD